MEPDSISQACNSRYLGIRDGVTVQGQPRQKVNETLSTSEPGEVAHVRNPS
jgi:hypothetical protein